MDYLLHSKFETYIFDEEIEEKVDESKGKFIHEYEISSYPEGFFSEL